AIIWVGALLALLAVPIILFVGKPSEDLSKYAAKEKPKQKPKRIALKMKERQSEKGLEVYVMSSEIDDSELKKLNNYTLINSLILKRTHVTGVGFKDLPGLSIEELYLDGCPVTFAGLKTIMQIPGLRTLSLRAVNEIDADWLRYLAGCRHLTQLSVSSPQLSKDPV